MNKWMYMYNRFNAKKGFYSELQYFRDIAVEEFIDISLIPNTVIISCDI